MTRTIAPERLSKRRPNVARKALVENHVPYCCPSACGVYTSLKAECSTARWSLSAQNDRAANKKEPKTTEVAMKLVLPLPSARPNKPQTIAPRRGRAIISHRPWLTDCGSAG